MIGTNNIAIDISPTMDNNSKRGVGFYTQHLVDALQKEIKFDPNYKDFKIDLIENYKSKIKNYDLIHYPYFDPFKLTLPVNKQPTIVTVHDLIPRIYKKHYPVGLKGEIIWQIQKTRLKKVDYIITDSHSSKYSIHKITKYPQDRIFTIYLAASSIYIPITNKKQLLKVQAKYKLPNKFVLYVGDINWNKNIRRLVSACQNIEFPLVIVGKSAVEKNIVNHPWNQDLIWLQHQKWPILTGFIPNEDMPSIFSLATCYCQPSIEEGFGLPVIEAMACGCPVSYSLKSSLAEIVDYNGIPFNPESIVSIQMSLKKIWSSPSLRLKLSQKGLIHSQTFSWSNTAKQTLAVYKLALTNER